MSALLVAAMTAPLWGGFLAIAWQCRKLARTWNARTLPARNEHNPGTEH